MFGLENLDLKIKPPHRVDTLWGNVEKPMAEDKDRLSAHMVSGNAVWWIWILSRLAEITLGWGTNIPLA